MRISDWSSDVCSSDLQRLDAGLAVAAGDGDHLAAARVLHRRGQRSQRALGVGDQHLRQRAVDQARHQCGAHAQVACAGDVVVAVEALALRLEEHTSELQSLMRISYAVFCLKKINKITPKTTQ